MAPHAYHSLHVHLVSGLDNAEFVEYFPDNQIVNYPLITTESPVAKDGYIEPLDGPGLGYRHTK